MGFQRLPPSGACPSCGRPAPRVLGDVDHQRLELGEQLAPARHRERADHADGRQAAHAVTPLRRRRRLVDVEAEQQRPDRVRGGLVDAVAGDHAVGRPHVLDLRHHPLVGLVGEVGALGDHAVEPGALEALEPGARDLLVAGDRREVDRRRGVRQRPLERGAAVRERLAREVVVAEREQVEGDEARRASPRRAA